MKMRAISFLARPQISLVALTILYALGVGIVVASGKEVGDSTKWLWSFSFSLLLAWWVGSDRKDKKFSAPFEHEAAVFFGWPIVVPYYLYRTRGRKGLLLGLGVWGLYLSPVLIAAAVYVVI